MSAAIYLQSNPVAFAAVAGVLGMLIGSFLNVVVHRLPRMMERDWRTQCAEIFEQPAPEPQEPYNLIAPRSRCPQCGHQITALENVPVLSYLVLGGRCSSCRTAISKRYPVVEALAGVLSAAVAWHFGFGIEAAGALVLTWALIALTFIDLDTQLLPDSITLPLLWLGLALNLGDVFSETDAAILGAIMGYGILWGVYHLFRLITGKEGMGHGDFKLLAMLGAWLGWQALPLVILLSSLVGAVVGLTMIVARGHDRAVPIPFGPYLAAAGWLGLMWGADITDAYLRWSLSPA